MFWNLGRLMLYIFIGQNMDYRELLQIGVLIKKVNENIGNRRNLQESYYCRNLKKTVCKPSQTKRKHLYNSNYWILYIYEPIEIL